MKILFFIVALKFSTFSLFPNFVVAVPDTYDFNENLRQAEIYRVTCYYLEGYGQNQEFKKMTIKISVTNEMYGETIKVISYLTEYQYNSFWNDLPFPSAVSKLSQYDQLSSKFTYKAIVNSKTVYFNL